MVSPELADVLCAVRHDTGRVPLVPAYDWHECVWRPPAPVLFQRRFGIENRAISHGTIRTMIKAALADTGLTDPTTSGPLNYTPHDFRRLFITDAVLDGLPLHIAQVIAGHQDINATLGSAKLCSTTQRSLPSPEPCSVPRRAMTGVMPNSRTRVWYLSWS